MTDTLDLSDVIKEICSAFDVSPNNVASITIKPDTIEIVAFRLNAEGRKYVLRSGVPATNKITSPIITAGL